MNADDSQSVIRQARSKMSKAVEHTLHEFSTLHTGKASPSMLDGIQVSVTAYGGSHSAVKDLAAISTPDPRTLQIQAWDKAVVGDIKRAIETANLGLNPVVDGCIIRINVPELSGERRKELVKVAHNMAEEGRIGVRQVRHDGMATLKRLEKKEGTISEDEKKRSEKTLQKITDENIEAIAEHLAHKEKELTTV